MPKLVSFSELNTLGVINITPNSFSDPNRFLDLKVLHSEIIYLLSIPNLAIDFGFESTAPMNLPISPNEERVRFDSFFEQIKDIDLSEKWISFDTYKVQNYLYFEKQFQARYQNCGFIFNDVSGVLNPELLKILEAKKNQENFYYIYNYSHIPSRENVLDHMNYIKEGDIVDMCSKYFSDGYKKLSQLGLQRNSIFDPGFGFSKSYDQNWDLLNRFDKLILQLNGESIEVPWLIGLSKKSFLRKFLKDSIDPFNDSEILHTQMIQNLVLKKLGHLLFRVHNPKTVVF